jgi:hypothetical protein
VLKKELPPELRQLAALYTSCIAGPSVSLVFEARTMGAMDHIRFV